MDSVTHLLVKHGMETVYDLYFQQLFRESIEKYTEVSETHLKLYKPMLNQGIKTRSKTKEVLRVPKFRSIVMGKSLSVKILEALNFLIRQNLLPDDVET